MSSAKKISFAQKNIQHTFQKQQYLTKQQKDKYKHDLDEARKISKTFSILCLN